MSTTPSQHAMPRRRRWRRRWTVRLLMIAALMVMLTLFAAANFVLVEVRLIVWEGNVRLAWALMLACIFGFIAGVAVSRLPR